MSEKENDKVDDQETTQDEIPEKEDRVFFPTQAQKHLSQFSGITWDSDRQRWRANIHFRSKLFKICTSQSEKDCAAKLHKWITGQIKRLENYLIPGYDHTKDQVDDIGVEMMEEAGFDPEHSYLAKRRADREQALKDAGVEVDEEEEDPEE